MATDAKSDRRVARCLAGVAAAVAVSLAMPLHAAGAPPPRPGDVSAVAQYFETFPTSEGERLSGPREGAAPLPPAVEARVRSDAGADAPALIELATSPERGAPPKPTAPDAAAGEATDPPAVAAPAVAAPSFTDAASDAALGGRSSRLLLPLLGLISVGLVTAALVGRRRRGSFR